MPATQHYVRRHRQSRGSSQTPAPSEQRRIPSHVSHSNRRCGYCHGTGWGRFTHPRSGSSHCHLLWQAAICWASGTRAPGSARSAAVSDSNPSSDSYIGQAHQGKCRHQRFRSISATRTDVSSLRSSTPPPFCVRSAGRRTDQQRAFVCVISNCGAAQ